MAPALLCPILPFDCPPAPALLPSAPQETKLNLRGDYAQQWAAYAEPEAEGAWEMLCSPAVVGQLGAVLERLSGGKKKASGHSRL